MENRLVNGMGNRKGCLISSLMIFGLALLIWHASRDIRLDPLKLANMKTPVLEAENVNFSRMISEDLWRVHTPRAERHGENLVMYSSDVWRQLTNGREWYFKSAYGVYSEITESGDFTPLLGTLETDTRVLNLESPHLAWMKKEKEFLFPRGVTLYDAEFLLEADVASIDEFGVILLDKGGVITWTKPRK